MQKDALHKSHSTPRAKSKAQESHKNLTFNTPHIPYTIPLLGGMRK